MNSNSNQAGKEPAVIPITDEALLQEADFMSRCNWRYKDARERYHSDLVYAPSIEYLRERWAEACKEAATYNCCNDYERDCLATFRNYLTQDLEDVAVYIWENSAECKAQVEAERLQKEKLKAEQEANTAFCKENQARRREHDAKLPDLGRQNIEDLVYHGLDFAHNLYQEFLSKEFYGWNAEYDPSRKGFFLPSNSPHSHLFFHMSGAIYDDTNGTENQKPIGKRKGFIVFYGYFALGYEPKGETHDFLAKDWKRALNGYASWLAHKRGVQEGTILEYGSFDYWEQFYDKVTAAMFWDCLEEKDGKLEGFFLDSPRNIFKTVEARVDKEERDRFAELKDEKTLKAHLYACCEGGEYHERSSHYFKTENVGRRKVERLKLTFNPECMPKPELTPEEQERLYDHCAALATGSGKVFIAPPVEENLQEQLEREFHIHAKEHEENPYLGDANVRLKPTLNIKIS